MIEKFLVEDPFKDDDGDIEQFWELLFAKREEQFPDTFEAVVSLPIALHSSEFEMLHIQTVVEINLEIIISVPFIEYSTNSVFFVTTPTYNVNNP